MPIRWRDTAERQYVVIEFSDPYSAPESERVLREIFVNRANDVPLRLLVDVRESAAPEAPFIHNAADFWRRHIDDMEGARIAVVVATDAQFGMARMAQIVSDPLPFRMRIFREEPDAVEWLQLD